MKIQLANYLASVRDGAGGNEPFDIAFSGDYESLTGELRAYLRALRFPSIQVKADLDLDKEFEVRKMPYAEVLYRLGELLTNHRPERPERRALFETAMEVDPDYGEPISAMAVEAERTANWTAARNLHERAVEASPESAMVLFRWGEFLSRRGGPYDESAANLIHSWTYTGPHASLMPDTVDKCCSQRRLQH